MCRLARFLHGIGLAQLEITKYKACASIKIQIVHRLARVLHGIGLAQLEVWR